jgi:tetratricopeptide (TPR) repeat protein
LVRLGMSEPDKAVVDFDQALALNQRNEEARAARGLALLMHGNAAEGLVDLNIVLERDPNNQLALLGRGMAMMTSGQVDRAIIAFNQIIGQGNNKGEDDSVARLLRARAYLAQRDPKTAMLDIEQVSTIKPNDPEMLTVRGLAQFAMKDYGRATDDFDQAIAKRETIENYIARGRAYEARNDLAHAEADFRRAVELKPRSVFDVAAQGSLKKKIEQLSKQIPCPVSGGSDGGGTCL